MAARIPVGAIGRAEQRLGQSQTAVNIFQSGQRTEEFFEDVGRETKRGADIGSILGGGLSLLGMAALSAATGGAALPLLGKMIIAGAGTGIGAKLGAEKGAKKAGLSEFEERFHRRDIRRGKKDVRQLIGGEAIERGAQAAMLTALPGLEQGGQDLFDMILKLTGSGLTEPWYSGVTP